MRGDEERDVDELERTVERIEATLKKVVDLLSNPPSPPPNPAAAARLVALRPEGATPMNIKDSGEQITWVIQEQDATGAVLTADTGTATWSSTDETVLTLEVAADGFSAIGHVAGAAGTTAGVNCSLDIGRTKDDGTGNQVPDPILLADAVLVTPGDVTTAQLVGSVTPTP